MARIEPSWIRIAKVLFASPVRPKKCSSSSRWPVEDTGKNSVSPSTKPSTTVWISCSASIISPPRSGPFEANRVATVARASISAQRGALLTAFQLPTFSGGVRTHCVVGIGRDSLLGTKSSAGEVPHGRDDQSVVGGRARRMRVRGSAFGPAPAQPHRAHGGRDRGKLAARVPGLGEHEGGLPLLLQ